MIKISYFLFGLILSFLIGFSVSDSFAQSTSFLSSPGFYEISQYAIGTVGIQIVFVESDGSIDSNKYDWTESEMKQTEEGIKKGLDFWSEQYPFEYGKLEFVFRDSVLGKTGIESSDRLSVGWFTFEDYRDVVRDTLTDVECGDVSDTLSFQDMKAEHDLRMWGDEFLIQVLSCANQVRNDLGTDWATVIFVPYAESHVNGLAFGFTDGSFIIDRYSVIGDSVGLIPAHEWAHMVGATDMIECDLFGPDDKQCGEKGGYLWMDETDIVPMTNCLLGNTGNHGKTIDTICVSDGTKNQIGWVDKNNNKIPDLIENDVSVDISNILQGDSTIIIEGIAKLIPVKCMRQIDIHSSSVPWKCKDTTINRISEITSDYMVTSMDGDFDSSFEHFSISLSSWSSGKNHLQLEIKDTLTNTIHFRTIEFEIESISSNAQSVPAWIKNNAEWWANDTIDDTTFITGIEFLIKEKILNVTATSTQTSTESIPSWVKNNAEWWADDIISEDDFLQGIEYLIEKGIIKI